MNTLRAAPRHFPKDRPAPAPRHGAFLREFLRNPAGTAAIAPSSHALALRMIEDIDLAAARSIVEFGPGSGAFTRAMLDRLPSGWLVGEGGQGRFIAIEYNPRMAEIVQYDAPRADVVVESAANIEKVCAERGIQPGTLDAVISGLGFASFPNELTTSILEAVHRMLRPGGRFRTFTYHVSLLKREAWYSRSEMRRIFSRVEHSRAVWGNLPPAFVYRCTK
jgi:phospholipid N-methyltransferase